jgi:hypothetical protein
MKRMLALLLIALGLVAAAASSALAQYPPTNVPSPELDPAPAGRLPFTGVDFSWMVMALILLVLVGLIMLRLGRHSKV